MNSLLATMGRLPRHVGSRSHAGFPGYFGRRLEESKSLHEVYSLQKKIKKRLNQVNQVGIKRNKGGEKEILGNLSDWQIKV